MEDRLADLKGGVRIPVTAETAPDELMPAFNKKINAIQYYLNKVKENNVKIKQLKDKHLSTTLIEKENEISEELDNIISENAKNCNIIKGELEYMEAEVAKAKENEKDEPETRIRDITYRALKGKFAEVLKEAQKIQIDYKTTVKAKITRQVKAMDPNLTPDQIEEIYNDPNGTTKLLQDKMLGQGHLKLRNAVADIQDKYKDIRKLEKSVEAIHQMFVDMQLLVHAQGEMLDTIEINVEGAHDYVKKANVQLAKAKQSHITYKKYRCCLLILVLIIIAVVIIVPIATKV